MLGIMICNQSITSRMWVYIHFEIKRFSRALMHFRTCGLMVTCEPESVGFRSYSLRRVMYVLGDMGCGHIFLLSLHVYGVTRVDPPLSDNT